jgi:hypothetical protein
VNTCAEIAGDDKEWCCSQQKKYPPELDEVAFWQSVKQEPASHQDKWNEAGRQNAHS